MRSSRDLSKYYPSIPPTDRESIIHSSAEKLYNKRKRRGKRAEALEDAPDPAQMSPGAISAGNSSDGISSQSADTVSQERLEMGSSVHGKSSPHISVDLLDTELRYHEKIMGICRIK